MNFIMEEEMLHEMKKHAALRNDAHSFALEALGKKSKVMIQWFGEPVKQFTSVDEFEAFWKQRFGEDAILANV